jgi:hypothetical protein
MHENRARAALLAAGLLAGAATPAPAADITTAIPSGLSWRSGASGASPCLAQLRGRAMDANNSFIGHQSFPGMVSETRGAQAKAGLAPLWVVIPNPDDRSG